MSEPRTSSAKDECPACVASRRSVVDAYFDGYLAGAVEMTLSEIRTAQPEDPDAGMLVFCVPHEVMATRVIAAMAAKVKGLR